MSEEAWPVILSAVATFLGIVAGALGLYVRQLLARLDPTVQERVEAVLWEGALAKIVELKGEIVELKIENRADKTRLIEEIQALQATVQRGEGVLREQITECTLQVRELQSEIARLNKENFVLRREADEAEESKSET